MLNWFKYGQARNLRVSLYSSDAQTVATGLSFVAGDVLVDTDGGGFANADNDGTITEIGKGVYSLQLSAAELTGQDISVAFDDQTAPKAWMPVTVNIETYGHPSAKHEFDFDSHPFAVSAANVPVVGTVNDSIFTPTTTQFETTDNSATQTPDANDVDDNCYRDRSLYFTTTARARTYYRITASDLVVSGRVRLTVTPEMPLAPANGAEFVIQ